jgi:hypothetical protein
MPMTIMVIQSMRCGRSPSSQMPKSATHRGAVNCRKTALAAVVHLVAWTKVMIVTAYNIAPPT